MAPSIPPRPALVPVIDLIKMIGEAAARPGHTTAQLEDKLNSIQFFHTQAVAFLNDAKGKRNQLTENGNANDGT